MPRGRSRNHRARAAHRILDARVLRVDFESEVGKSAFACSMRSLRDDTKFHQM